ncbi:tRNA (adenosine(37)-N6)-threonylcarbamoyltransferase complex dimerization subunit type 1 TsaB [Phycicoccus endophyticus]|uniref:tRNA (Adenosine(37)-N6)-threonylcarbamoyltransferase complex dimerization subunit type 1 TsaB n=1 Tax=Phycicoccus endophyticus TaxID=1690220 RepID=A0A7G9R2K6_9MICO|nr:tRNA (adenosine(37)-N6)-threonylcarbamoyltransferase complex dimerization subunit type 1 TsaB [Phycicoccus endophyticus]NHI20708.1 tRNA (adenosine(37)-N6)-threonylcarbamoyltransferase complex dimerization subunit type 1 TsaB [Phycicoccus endophyticus]QNN49831.1 tRNA (adenosine(37)-N6)-threonylcarbamoyltransferase complex dimerization subunit type 1 TsaB [Phycicoccus endophyticus]GGL35551.1 tRNA (adenosine(37)-N6)-threonylcarbamoyltransferase complex dimerization subunit type 1 TsaB [Phycicocc
MLTLAIDTATSAVAVAVHRPGSEPVRAVEVDPRGHTELLAPLVQRALRAAGAVPADLTDVAVGTGPGPFTGLRVGLVTAVTTGYALGVPVHGVCSLDVLAEQGFAATDAQELLVATDARRREVYWARYGRGPDGARPLSAPAVEAAEHIPAALRRLPVAGRGALLYPDALPGGLDVLDVDPAVLARVAQRRVAAGVPTPVEPRYLRRPDALTTAERASR